MTRLASIGVGLALVGTILYAFTRLEEFISRFLKPEAVRTTAGGR